MRDLVDLLAAIEAGRALDDCEESEVYPSERCRGWRRPLFNAAHADINIAKAHGAVDGSADEVRAAHATARARAGRGG